MAGLLTFPIMMVETEDFYHKNNKKNKICFSIAWHDYNKLIANVIKEASSKKMKKLSNFRVLLTSRLIDYYRNKNNKEFKEIPFEDWMERKFAEEDGNDNKKFDRLLSSIDLIEELESSIHNGTFNDKMISSKLIKIANQFKIKYFLGIPIGDISCFIELNKTSHQNRAYHSKRFDSLIRDSIKSDKCKEILRYLSISEFGDEDDCEPGEIANKFATKGREYKDLGKSLHTNFLGVNSKEVGGYEDLSKSKVFMLSFLHFLKASFLFKECILENPSYIRARYNYAYCLKRLGKISECIGELEDCIENLTVNHDKKIKSLINEGIGDAYLLSGEFMEANSFFQIALEDSPNDLEIYCNIIESYYRNNGRARLVEWMEKLLERKSPIPEMRKILFYQILNAYKHDEEIKSLCIRIINL